MNSSNTFPLSDEIVNTFEKDGAVCVRGLFEQTWLDTLSIGVEKNFADPGPSHSVYTKKREPGGFYDDYCNWNRFDEYRDFIMNSPAGELAARITQSNTARIYHEHVLVKEPGTKEITPWHHDLPYYGVDGNQLCSIWLPLDPVPQAACPEFVAGSHASGQMYYPKLFSSHENYGAGESDFLTIPDIDQDRAKHRILSWDLQPGDCIVFHMRTIHGAPATTRLNSRRRGFSTRWIGDDARFAKRPWKTSPPYPEVQLTHGDVMEHPSFPLVWQRPDV